MKNIITHEEKNRIDAICKENKIFDYTINNDGSIDVDDNVVIRQKNISELPLNFNVVNGFFACSGIGLTTLLGSPKKLSSAFFCNSNNLTSLEHCPIDIPSHFVCSNNYLTSLEFSPKTVGLDFLCENNQLTTLQGCPTTINGKFNFAHNYLETLEGFPTKVGTRVILTGNPSLDPDFVKAFKNMKYDELSIFLKYQHQFFIWDDGYDEGAFYDLLNEIKTGLL